MFALGYSGKGDKIMSRAFFDKFMKSIIKRNFKLGTAPAIRAMRVRSFNYLSKL